MHRFSAVEPLLLVIPYLAESNLNTQVQSGGLVVVFLPSVYLLSTSTSSVTC